MKLGCEVPPPLRGLLPLRTPQAELVLPLILGGAHEEGALDGAVRRSDAALLFFLG